MLLNSMPKISLLPNGGLVSFRNELVVVKQYILEDLTMNWPCKHLLLKSERKELSGRGRSWQGKDDRWPCYRRYTNDADFLCVCENVRFEWAVENRCARWTKGELPCESVSCQVQIGLASIGYLVSSLQNGSSGDWRDIAELTWNRAVWENRCICSKNINFCATRLFIY